jgi:hypothetical protein
MPRIFPAALAEALPHAPEAGELAMLEQALTDAFVGPDSPPGPEARSTVRN